MKRIIFFLCALFFSSASLAQNFIPLYGIVAVSGTDTYTASVNGTGLSLQNGLTLKVKFTNANTSTATLNVTFNSSASGAVALTKNDGTALSSGDIASGSNWFVQYDASANKWKLVGGGGGGISLPISDDTALLKDNADNTKLALLEASNIPAGTTNTYTLPAISNLLTGAAATANSQAGNYTLALTDYSSQKAIYFTGSSGMVLTLPDNAGAAIPTYVDIPVMRTGTGSLTFATSGSATVTYSSTQNADLGRYQQMFVMKTGADAWLVKNGSPVITGDIAINITGVSSYNGVVPPNKGGTGIANNANSTLSISGAFPTTFTVGATTALTLPADGNVLAVGTSNKTFASDDKTNAITFNTLGGASGLTLSSTSTAAASNLQKVLEVTQSGANSTSAQSTWAADFSNIKTGTTSVNYGLRAAASGGATNRSIQANGPFAFGDTFYSNPTNETTSLGFFRKDQNNISAVQFINATSGTGGRFAVQISPSATVATSLNLQAYSAAFSTSGIAVASATSVDTNATAGMNVGTTSATQLSLWTNNTSRMSMTSNGNVSWSQAAQGSSNTFTQFTQAAHNGGTSTGLLFTGGALTAQTAATEVPDIDFNLARTVQFASNTGVTLQRAVRFRAPTYAFASATGTITDAATVQIDGAPAVGTNAAITNPWAFRIAAGNANFFGKHVFDATLTAGGTTGNQTINKPAGSVNIAASGTAVTVTNSFVTTSSLVQAWVMTNDATALVKNVTVASGSFTVNMNAAVTGETKIGFIVMN